MVPQFSLFTLSWCVHNSNFIWILGFMVDISNYLLWFINKLISGGRAPPCRHPKNGWLMDGYTAKIMIVVKAPHLLQCKSSLKDLLTEPHPKQNISYYEWLGNKPKNPNHLQQIHNLPLVKPQFLFKTSQSLVKKPAQATQVTQQTPAVPILYQVCWWNTD